jgi:hypothetical protein
LDIEAKPEDGAGKPVAPRDQEQPDSLPEKAVRISDLLGTDEGQDIADLVMKPKRKGPCSRCGGQRDRDDHGYCRECRNDYQKRSGKRDRAARHLIEKMRIALPEPE